MLFVDVFGIYFWIIKLLISNKDIQFFVIVLSLECLKLENLVKVFSRLEYISIINMVDKYIK